MHQIIEIYVENSRFSKLDQSGSKVALMYPKWHQSVTRWPPSDTEVPQNDAKLPQSDTNVVPKWCKSDPKQVKWSHLGSSGGHAGFDTDFSASVSKMNVKTEGCCTLDSKKYEKLMGF